MKIEKVELSNVYGHESALLDLSGTSAAVMIGANGAGKSSLIDGALFALFGRPAVRGGSLANVVRQGAQVASARVEFEIDGSRWRVTRTYSTKTKAGASTCSVERQIGGEWQGGADSGALRDVDAQICDLLGTDLRGFTLASVMRQGDSSAFTALTAGDKLKALSALVGADKLRAAAEAAGTELTSCKREIDALAREVEEAQRLANDAAAAASTAADLRSEAVAARAAAEDAATRYAQLTSEGEAAAAAAREAGWKIEEFERQLKALLDDEERCGALEGRVDAQTRLVDALRRATAVASEARDDDAAAQRAQLEGRLSELDQRCGAYCGAVEEIKIAESFDSSPWAKSFEPASTLSDRIDAAREESKGLERALTTAADLRERIALLDEQISAAEETQRRAAGRLRAQAASLSGRPDACTFDGCGLIQGALLAKSDLVQLERQDPAAAPRQDREGLATRLAEIMTGLGSTADASARLDQLEEQIERDSAALIEARRVEDNRARLDRMRAGLGEDPRPERDSVKAALAAVVLVEQQQRHEEQQRAARLAQLSSEERALADVTADLDSVRARLVAADVSAHRQILEGYRATRDASVARRAELRATWAALKLEVEDSDARRAATEAAAARAEGRAAGLAEATARASASSTRLSGAKREALELSLTRDFLRAAPQMVVASAIPMIEASANEILRDVAPGITLRVERQRETKAGDARDEITITVHTSAGQRDLDTFSGGERFRLDVALRLALARLAAGRSGTSRPLQTLIVDEGWGSLDPDGVQALKDTFARLRGRFERILVVTHVPDVVDLFGQSIEVERPAEGATQITTY